MTSNNKKKKPFGIVDPKVGNYEKHPYFVKKANAARKLLLRVGLPKVLST